ncbi:MAG: phosphodiester glycosidase family protein [Cytophagaceae bacterium]
MKKAIIILFPFLLFILTSSHHRVQQSVETKVLDTGLVYLKFPVVGVSAYEKESIEILKIDPKCYQFEIGCATKEGIESKPLNQWMKDKKWVAAVNAGMFKLEGNFKQCTGYMKVGTHMNNPNTTANYKSYFACQTVNSKLAGATLIDATTESVDSLKRNYSNVVQGIRMLDAQGKNIWQYQEKKWSMVLLGKDANGNILYIFTRAPYRVYDFINELKKLPIQLTRLMYLEGGPEASFGIQHPQVQRMVMGSFETGFNENNNNQNFWAIPNVIGIVKK